MTIVKRLPPEGATESDREHDRQKHYRLVAYVDGAPKSCWKTDTVPVSAIVARPAVLDERKARLILAAEEYHANYVALQALENS